MANKDSILNSINEFFGQQRNEVSNAYPSLYSKDDVLILINRMSKAINDMLEQDLVNVTSNNVNSFTIGEIFDTIQNDLNVNDYCSPDCDSAEFELDSNTIYLNHCEFTFNNGEFLSDLEDRLNELRNNQ